ncbi:dTDP-4-dehydrorhamnose 3,5-epimerase family protein, partial [Streptosporangium sandarakinum]
MSNKTLAFAFVRGTIRGLHGRSGRGEAKLVRCARGAVHDVLVD